jgi:hypothetical protein
MPLHQRVCNALALGCGNQFAQAPNCLSCDNNPIFLRYAGDFIAFHFSPLAATMLSSISRNLPSKLLDPL